ncbi:MAG: universal stress protein [Bacteroidia bacterium]|nr:universal stress protein [Bacteroidia bacterium]NND25158.1 universal stress protein [Flavobacteriaceae bacterium]MBT8277887.1 universal stress protein [Bacteroidia bacterium]NNK61531.1 universal stress protein [Flavobacteriaceae bacterium]NNL33935.1 universal stress protein [Flavobacteriaceae bacterium]
MKNILVPVGTSENAVSHLQYAVDFARAFGANLFVVQVYNVYTKAGTIIKVDHIIERESLSFLKKHISKIDTTGVEVTAKLFKGKLVDTIEKINKSLNIDLLLLEPKTNSVKEEVFLGNTSGRIVKQTKIPILIVPEGLKYKPMPNILFAIKSAILKKEKSLDPLKEIQAKFNAKIHLLLVKTQYHKEGDFEVSDTLSNMVVSTTYSENPTTYLGVLEHIKQINPDLLVVVRRKRGFFTKLWEKNSILKKDLYITTIPILVLREMK